MPTAAALVAASPVAALFATSLVSLLIVIIILCGIVYLFNLLPLPQPAKTIVMVVVALFFLLWLLGALGGGPGLDLRL